MKYFMMMLKGYFLISFPCLVCIDHQRCSTYIESQCGDFWIQKNCRRLCSLCVNEVPVGSGEDETAPSTNTTTAASMNDRQFFTS